MANTKRAVVVITGCSNGGIGSYLGKQFVLQGCTTYATARNLSSTSDAEAWGCMTLQLDVNDKDSVQEAIQHVLKNEGRIDYLINNAGIGSMGPLIELDLNLVSKVMDTNLLGPLRVIQAVAPHMIKRRMGTVVNVGSIVGDMYEPWTGIYCSSKAALHSMTNCLRLELSPFNIDVVAVKPGYVESQLFQKTIKFLTESYEDEGYKESLLQPASAYKPLEPTFATRMKRTSNVNAYPSDMFAKQVVAWLLSRRNPSFLKRLFILLSRPFSHVLYLFSMVLYKLGIRYKRKSLSYFYNPSDRYGRWQQDTEFILGGYSHFHTLFQYAPRPLLDFYLWSYSGMFQLTS
ncbi:hypothetical protein DSO57_1007237 [Entomophthora muscae]|uniref:Uncharacterized protein n=1 Tax=Entomophthora muscae TaxID=34485 RepID=A0ACC2UGH0_9FUNG|nr:hypothetical protein DSO57_1007237 [Entomophthora muscae]